MSTRVLVRGAGSIGTRHAQVFHALGCDVSVWPARAASRPDPSTAFAATLNDAEGRAALPLADLVVVATNTGRHVADTVEALDAGAFRVLVEKPIAPSVDAARELTEHPRVGDVWVAAPLRAMSGFRHLLGIVPSLGDSLSAHVWSQSWLPDWRPGRDYRETYSARLGEGGVLRDLVHELDYVTLLFGEASLIGAQLEHGGPLEMAAEQAATLLLTTPTAPSVSLRLDYITRPATRGITIRGPRGGAEWAMNEQQVRRTNTSGQMESRTFLEDADRDETMAGQARAILELRLGQSPSEAHELRAPATYAEGLATLRLCDAARFLSNQRATPRGIDMGHG